MSNQKTKKTFPTHTETQETHEVKQSAPLTLWHDVLKKHNNGKIPKKGTDEYTKVKAIYDDLKQRGINKKNSNDSTV